jgi:hypothetical protein
MKRWRLVKKRAYLQALGLRALWRVNSLSDRHEPLELLTNDLPSVRHLLAGDAQPVCPAKNLRTARQGVITVVDLVCWRSITAIAVDAQEMN